MLWEFRMYFVRNHIVFLSILVSCEVGLVVVESPTGVYNRPKFIHLITRFIVLNHLMPHLSTRSRLVRQTLPRTPDQSTRTFYQPSNLIIIYWALTSPIISPVITPRPNFSNAIWLAARVKIDAPAAARSGTRLSGIRSPNHQHQHKHSRSFLQATIPCASPPSNPPSMYDFPHARKVPVIPERRSPCPPHRLSPPGSLISSTCCQTKWK